MKKSYIILLLSCLFLGSCYKEDPIDPNREYINLGGESWPESDLDRWINENFTEPYNMTVMYKWDHNSVALTSTLVPVEEDKVKPIMDMIRKIWIEPYETLAGPVFVKTYCPKKFILVGSPQYNSDGTINLGLAEGATTVTLLRLNWLKGSDDELVREVLKTVHHEFGHILHMQIMYPTEYKQITPGSYESNWAASANTDAIARDLGFISRYARSSADEDFVEMLCRIVIYGRDAFMERVNASTETGRAALLRKEEILESYMKNTWGVNLYDSGTEKGLVTLVQEAIDEVVANSI